jgi:hypothetical protein
VLCWLRCCHAALRRKQPRDVLLLLLCWQEHGWRQLRLLLGYRAANEARRMQQQRQLLLHHTSARARIHDHTWWLLLLLLLQLLHLVNGQLLVQQWCGLHVHVVPLLLQQQLLCTWRRHKGTHRRVLLHGPSHGLR